MELVPWMFPYLRDEDICCLNRSAEEFGELRMEEYLVQLLGQNKNMLYSILG